MTAVKQNYGEKVLIQVGYHAQTCRVLTIKQLTYEGNSGQVLLFCSNLFILVSNLVAV